MIFNQPRLFDNALEELAKHALHKLSLMLIGGDAAPESLAIECEDCHEMLIEFLPEPTGASGRTLITSSMKVITTQHSTCVTSRCPNQVKRPIHCRSGRTSSTIRPPASPGDTEARVQRSAPSRF